MKLKTRVVAVALAATMVISLLQYPVITVRADEIARTAEDIGVEDNKATDVTAGEITFDGTQSQENDESQSQTDKNDVDTNNPEDNENMEDQKPGIEDESTSGDEESDGDDTAEDGGSNTKPDEGDGEENEDNEKDNLEGDNGNITDDIGTGNDEIPSDAEQNPVEEEAVNAVVIATDVADISGVCGENVTWTYNGETNKLVISGTGDMQYYYSDVTHNDRPYPLAGVTTVIISDGITGIAMRAFARYSVLADVVIADSVTSIDSQAFSTCSNLTSIIIPNSVTNIGSGVFEDCRSLKDVVLSNNIASIPSRAFSACRSLEAILIPDSVTSIGIGAFSSCTSLINIQIPKGVTSIERDAFSGCNSLIDISVDVENPEFTSREGVLFNKIQTALICYPEGKTEAGYCIPSGVTTVIGGAFSNCNNLKSIVIPKSVTAIERGAFFSAKNIILDDVYYEGSEDEWNAILIDPGNTCLTDATIHYNSTGMGGGEGDDTPVKPPVKPSDPNPTDTSLQIFDDVYYYDTIAGVSVNIDLSWSWNYLLTWNSEVYNPSLAKMGVALSAAIEGSVADLGEILIGKDNNRAKGLGCDAIEYSPTSPGAVFGHKTIIKADGKTEHVIFVVIRGTTSVKDVINDIKSGTNNGDWGHYEVYNNLRSCLAEWSSTYGGINPGNTKFFVTGHSLGGACANILSAQLTEEYGENNVFGYTFAAPSPFSEKLSKNNYRNIHNFLCYNDHVPSRLNRQDPWYGNGYYTWFYADKSSQMVTSYMDLTGKLLQDEYAIGVINLGLHAPSAYMAFLMTNPDLNKTASNVSYIRAKCPVDIEVYNSGNELVGHIVNDEVDYNNYTSDVMLTVTDGAKCVYFLNDDTYTIKFSGTGDGTMVYTAASKDMNSNTIEETKVYSNVCIESGKKLKSIVSSYDETNTDILVEIPNVELLVVNDEGNTVARVLSDSEASAAGKSNGTEVPIGTSDNTDNNTGGNASGGNSGSRPGNNSSDDTLINQDGNGMGISSSENSGSKTSMEAWKPTTPDEKKRYACMGKDAVQYTLPEDNAYRIVIENAMQGPMCFKSFETVLGEYTVGRTYNVYTFPDTVYSMDKEIQFTIKIPSDIYKKDREYKMICVTKDGQPIVYEDIDDKPETITIKTNKFYAYALIYK